ncbi:uncharacterized protein LOC127583599 [Pristis pectinata]|uniref:uncharacterized protein LOC127583599 n=1 Tax=Pristis pectinata TaxID=685728 RepID=UPI00223CD29C|nr:uncharacterized protein LOC127583599 [Pristis pectinata]
MLYKVLSPDGLHDQSSNDSGIDDCFRGSNRSPPAGEFPAIPSNYALQSPHSVSPTASQLCKRERKTTTETVNKNQAESEKKYLGVRVRLPVRDLLRNYRKAKGEEPKDIQEDVTRKLNNERRRVVRDTLHGHPCSAKQSKQIKNMNVCPPKNFEDLLEDLVEVLETDLKQGGLDPHQTQIEIDCPQRCYMGCPVSLRDLHSKNHHPVLQTNDPAFHCHLGYLYENNTAHLDLVSPFYKPYSGLECESWYHSPGWLATFAGERCGNVADEGKPFSWHHCSSHNTRHPSYPHSPLPEAKAFDWVALSNTQSSRSTQGGSNGLLEASQQQYLPGSSALSFFQFQLQQIERSLIALSPEDLLSVDKNGNTLLHYAVIQGKRALAYGLACRMSDMSRIDAKNSRGQTALHLAAERNQHLMVSDLISLGAQINERDILGKTPVHLCAENGFLQVLQVIGKTLKNGTDVDIDARDNNYLTPLHYVVLAHIATVKEFENSEMGSDMHRFLALRKDQLLDGMRCLLRMGSSISMQDMNGRSAIHFAEEENDTEVLNFLYDHVDKMKTIAHKEFGSYAILDSVNQKAELPAMAPELPPCKNYKQTSNVPQGTQQDQ